MTTSKTLLSELFETAPANLSLENAEHLDQVRKAADDLFECYGKRKDLEALEKSLFDNPQTPLFVHLAVKLAISKKIVANIKNNCHVSIVFAVYKEQNRILTQAEHPNGEDFLMRKIIQISWLFNQFANFSWDLFMVDDGDPEKTGEIAKRILAQRYDGNNVKVLFLEEAIKSGIAVTAPMQSADESQKGGSIVYGMWEAVQAKKENHIVVFTDADLSTHLGQIGLLIDGIINQGKKAAIGSRRESTSVVIKNKRRNVRGKLFIYLWKRLIPNLDYLIDTQCGFKAFSADSVRSIVPEMIEKRFAFDIELLLKTELLEHGSILKVPVVWIDSEAESTTTDLAPYLPMLQSLVKIYRKYLPKEQVSEDFAGFIEKLDKNSWKRLVDNAPAAIAEKDPSEFDQAHVDATEFEQLLNQ